MGNDTRSRSLTDVKDLAVPRVAQGVDVMLKLLNNCLSFQNIASFGDMLDYGIILNHVQIPSILVVGARYSRGVPGGHILVCPCQLSSHSTGLARSQGGRVARR